MSRPFGAAAASKLATFSIVTSFRRRRGACGSGPALFTGGQGARPPFPCASRTSPPPRDGGSFEGGGGTPFAQPLREVCQHGALNVCQHFVDEAVRPRAFAVST